jgi:hypothetical protein
MKYETSREIYAQTVDLVKTLAANPVVELILAFALIEKLQDRGVLGSLQGTAMEAGVGALIAAQQMAPLMPSLIQAGTKGIEGITKLLPLLAAA